MLIIKNGYANILNSRDNEPEISYINKLKE